MDIGVSRGLDVVLLFVKKIQALYLMSYQLEVWILNEMC